MKKAFLILMVLCLLAALPIAGLASDEDLNLLWDIPFENTPDQVKQQVYDAAGVVLSEDSQDTIFYTLRKAKEQELSFFGTPIQDFAVAFIENQTLIQMISMDMFPADPADAASSEASLEKIDLLFSRFSEKYGKADWGGIIFQDRQDDWPTKDTFYRIPESTDGQPDYAKVRAAFETGGDGRTVLVIWAWKNVCLRFQFEQEGLITANVYWFCEKLLLTTGPLLELPDEIPLPGTITVKNQDLGL